MRIRALRVNHLENPVGFRMESTVFSWKVDGAEGKRQRSARLLVATDPDFRELVLDTGVDTSLDSVACDANFVKMPRTRYFWKVSVTSDAGEQAESETAFFETGKESEPWQAKWISCESDEARHPIFTKKIKPNGEIRSARLYICGLGLYEAFLDGKRIGDEFLAPGCNDYDRWLQYQTYDVTGLLSDGAELAVLMGNGWYKGRFSFFAADTKGRYGQDFALIAELHIDYTDGRHTVIATDESWRVRRSHITFSGIYDGERRDDTLPEMPEEAVMLLPKDTAKLTERMSPPVRVFERLPVRQLIHTPTGETVLDLGQNFSGIFALRLREKAGSRIRLQFGEVLQDGNFYRDNLRSALAEYVYISGGEEITLSPHFTFYGYRYVKVEGAEHISPEDFEGLAISSLGTRTGFFKTGNELVNRLIENARWGLLSNTVDVPTDCPQRDERLGWTGDAQVFAETAADLYETQAFYAKYLFDMAMEQKDAEGMVPNYIPSRGERKASAAWGDAACILPWILYRVYGDPSILKKQYESMRAWVEYIRRVDGNDHGWSRAEHFGDWLALDNESGDPNENSGATDKGYIAQVYYRESVRILARTATILGWNEDAAAYEKLVEKLSDHIRYEYFTGSGRCSVNTQTALLMALRYSLTANREWTKNRLRELFFLKNDKLLTGFVGTPLACETLSDNGMDDLALKLLLNEDYPGWLYAVKLGATTIWERWDSLLSDGSISGTGMNSLNHYAYGSVCHWMFARIGGIRQCVDSVGFRRVHIEPLLSWKLKSAEASMDTPCGVYSCRWRIMDPSHVEIRVTIPFGGEAELVLPGAKEKQPVRVLSAGEYSFAYETAEPFVKTLSTILPLGELLEEAEAREFLLSAVPQLSLINKSMQGTPLRDILLFAAGFEGLPSRDEMENRVLPELDEKLQLLEVSK